MWTRCLVAPLVLLSVAISACSSNGAAGPQGNVGPSGPPGQAGPAGVAGPPGDQGPPGASVTLVPLLPGGDAACPAGGTKFISGAVTSYACSAPGSGACPGAQALCGGACTRIDVDSANCGNCGNVCRSGTCVAGLCAKLAFVTSQSFNGNLGGVDGADLKCQAAAESAGLTGAYRAWLSDSLGNSPVTRFTRHVGAYALVNGAIVASSWSALVGVDASNPLTFLNHTISLTELGGQGSNSPWTGTNPTGISYASIYDCTNWTGLAGSGMQGGISNSNPLWTVSGASACVGVGALYCFEQ